MERALWSSHGPGTTVGVESGAALGRFGDDSLVRQAGNEKWNELEQNNPNMVSCMGIPVRFIPSFHAEHRQDELEAPPT